MKRFLFRHFEKGIFAFFVASFLVALARPIVARPAELDDSETIVALDAKLDAHFVSFEAPVPPVADELGRFHGALDAPGPVEPFSPWLPARRPSLALAIDQPPPLPPSFHEPPGISVSADHGSVTVEWVPSPKPQEAVVTGYTITRTDSAGKTVALDRFNAAGKRVDTDVVPRATYTYAVLETAEAPPSHAPLPIGQVELRAERQVTLPRDVILIPARKSVERDENGQPAKVKVLLNVWRKGAWVNKECFSVKIGDPIDKPLGREVLSSGAKLDAIEALPNGEVRIAVSWKGGGSELLSSTDSYAELAPRR